MWRRPQEETGSRPVQTASWPIFLVFNRRSLPHLFPPTPVAVGTPFALGQDVQGNKKRKKKKKGALP
jgi:hypothetical protein